MRKMKVLKRNQVPFYYCEYKGEQMKTDKKGNLTGEKEIAYSEAVETSGSISTANGRAYTELFGIDLDYDKVIVSDNLTLPISETTVLFVDKEPEYKNGKPLYDYIVKRVAPSLNVLAIAIKKVKVN